MLASVVNIVQLISLTADVPVSPRKLVDLKHHLIIFQVLTAEKERDAGVYPSFCKPSYTQDLGTGEATPGVYGDQR